MASELIIQLQNKNGEFSCEKFENLPSPKSAYVAICFPDNPESEQLAIELKTKLITSITSLGSKFSASIPSCEGNKVPFGGCQALSIADYAKLLIVVSNGGATIFANSDVLNWTNTTLNIIQSGKPVNLPPQFSLFQSVFWKRNIDEVIPIIFGKLGISDEDLRIFISYRRMDTLELAEQLFDRLHREGFEVFLDRFSIEPGIDFQNRLYQELADKAMVVFIESPNFLSSDWVQKEITFATLYRIGKFVLNINDAPKTPLIDDEYRKIIPSINLNSDQTLKSIYLDNIVNEIKRQHSIALYRKKNYINECVFSSLAKNGANPQYDHNGFIDVRSNKTGNHQYKIWTNPRPPSINDYHHTDTSNKVEKKIIVGPLFAESKRGILNDWLSNKSSIEFYNEGELAELADSIYI